jgi:hypothetical protein
MSLSCEAVAVDGGLPRCLLACRGWVLPQGRKEERERVRERERDREREREREKEKVRERERESVRSGAMKCSFKPGFHIAAILEAKFASTKLTSKISLW